MDIVRFATCIELLLRASHECRDGVRGRKSVQRISIRRKQVMMMMRSNAI